MPLFYVHVVNSAYESRDEGAEYDSADLALAAGVQSALHIAADEITAGQPTAAVEVSVVGADGQPLCRSVLALSVSPMLIPGASAPLTP